MAFDPDSRWQGTPLTDEAVIEPRANRIDPKIHDPVVFCPVGPMVAAVAGLYRARKKLKPFNPAAVYTVHHEGRRASLVGPAMGAPSAVYVLERLIANGVRHVIMIGLAGSISSEVRTGDLVIPTAALIEEGVSRQYLAGADASYPHPRALSVLEAAAEGHGRSYHLGPIWTTDTVFRETKQKVTEYGKSGRLAVEMEVSALFTVAHYRAIELAALLVVSDELFDLRWRPGFTRPRFLAALRQAGRIARAAAFNLTTNAPDAPAGEPAPEDPRPSSASSSDPKGVPGREPPCDS